MDKQKPLLEEITPYRWRLPRDYTPGMRVPGEIIASRKMIPHIISDNTPRQVANVATLPGIIGASLAMPDIHWGYGFPIGGVAAFDLDDGIISPGGVGYDINCGVSMLRSDLTLNEIRRDIPKLTDALFNQVPCGVGSEGRIKLTSKDFKRVLERGARWLVEQGMADAEDLEFMEERGAIEGGDAGRVSGRAHERGGKQLGTLGSGNHFLEIQVVEKIFDPAAADVFGLHQGQIVIMIHSGSRGLGHQVCDESLKVMLNAARRYGIELVDRQLACAPFKSPEGQDYFAMMKCAANYAWANRLAMIGLVRRAFSDYFRKSWQKLNLSVVWDVCHNIAKVEEFSILPDTPGMKPSTLSAGSPVKDGDGRTIDKKLCIHRKGATRACGPGHPSLPARYGDLGQPVIIPGDMGRASHVLVGTSGAADISFSSTCHGAGRVMSRKAAVKSTGRTDITQKLRQRGIYVRSRGKWTLNEEIPEAYKDIDEVVEAVEGAGISRKVARMKPLGTVKG